MFWNKCNNGYRDVHRFRGDKNVNSNHITHTFNRFQENCNQIERSTAQCNKNYIDIEINSTGISSLIDTGSDVCILNCKLLGKIPNLIKRLKPLPSYFHAKSASGHSLNFIGTVVLHIVINGRVFTHKAYVSNNILLDMILGVDFLTKYKVNLNLADNLISFPKELTVKSTKMHTIRPNTEKIVNARISGSNPLQAVVRYTPTNKLSKAGLTQCESIVRIDKDNDYVPVKLINDTNRTITVFSRTKLGTFTPIDKDDTIMSMDDFKTNKTPIANNVSTNKNKPMTRNEFIAQFELNNNITKNQKQQLESLLYKYSDIFYEEGKQLYETPLMKADIPLKPDARPFSLRPYKMNPQQSQAAQKIVDQLLQDDIIQHSDSPYNNPVILVPKGNTGEYRMCLDLRRLNKDVIDTSQQILPDINSLSMQIANQIANAKNHRQKHNLKRDTENNTYITKLDIRSAFHHLALTDSSKPCTAFAVNGQTYEFNRLVFGLKMGSFYFQKLLNKVIGPHSNHFASSYIDDIILVARSFSQMLSHMEDIFKKIRQAKLTVSPNKSVFCAEEVTFLGMNLNSEGIKPCKKHLTEIANFPQPKTPKQVRSFLGMTSWLRKFIPHHSQKAKPLYTLTKKDQKFVWNKEADDSFKELKECLISPNMLIHADFNKKFYLVTDASKQGLGYSLLQTHEGKLKPILYGSASLTPAQQKYAITKRELLAIYHSFHKLKHYLYGAEIEVMTDHKPLLQILKSKDIDIPDPQLTRWILFLNSFNFTVKHVPGKQNCLADALSRREVYEESALEPNIDSSLFCQREPQDTAAEENKLILDQDIAVISSITKKQDLNSDENTAQNLLDMIEPEENFQLTRDTIHKLQQSDQNLQPLIHLLQTGQHLQQTDKYKMKQVDAIAANYFLHEDILFHIYKDATTGFIHTQLVVPKPLRATVLQKAHSQTNGHFSALKTYHQLRQKFFWNSMYTDVVSLVRECATCSRGRYTRMTRQQMKSVPIHTRGAFIYADILGPFTKSESFTYILVVIEQTTHFVELYPLQSTTAQEVANTLLQEHFLRYGIPEKLMTDLGTCFTANIFQQMLKILGIQHLTTSPENHSANMAEVTIHSVTKQIRYLLQKHKDMSWHKMLGMIRFNLNTAVVSSTKASPFFLQFLRLPKTFFDCTFLKEINHNVNEQNMSSFQDILLQIGELQNSVKSNLEAKRLEQKRYYDNKASPKNFEIGELVWILFSKPLGQNKLSPKLQSKLTGPYIILQKEGDGHSYKVADARTMVPLKSRISANRFKKYFSPSPNLTPYSQEELTAITDCYDTLQQSSDMTILEQNEYDQQVQITQPENLWAEIDGRSYEIQKFLGRKNYRHNKDLVKFKCKLFDPTRPKSKRYFTKMLELSQLNDAAKLYTEKGQQSIPSI